MAFEISENFPRGGKKVSTTQKPPFFKTKNLFSTSSAKHKAKTSKKKKSISDEDKQIKENVGITVVDQLSYKNIQEGMLVLGCIQNITDLALKIELPGRTFGTIHINAISKEFTSSLKDAVAVGNENELVKLNAIFRIGQYIPTKVMNIGNNNDKLNVFLSTKPSDINADFNHRDLKKGGIIWGAVSSLSDHGYQITNGKKNCRIFLPFDKVEKERKLVVGEPFWCVVEKCNNSSLASTIIVSALNKTIFAAKEAEPVNLHSVIPGMAFNLVVNQHLKHGIEVHFNEECTGYVNECYFTEALQSVNKYKIGQGIIGRVLYIQPTTKQTYFTLRSLEDASQPQFEVGSVVTGQVVNTLGGIILKIGENNKGFISYKRALPALSKDVKTNVIDHVKKHYPFGRSHKCRILDYHHLDDIYICTAESNLLKEKWFTAKDIVIGENVRVTITDIKDSGIVVSFGCLKGFIKNIHISNAQYSDNIKKKFAVGQKFRAKFLSIDDRQSIYLTMKKALLNSDKVFKNYEEAVVGENYPGVVIKTYKAGVLFAFYDDIKGFLPANQLGGISVQESYYIGQVVNVFISKVEDDKITLSLKSVRSQSNETTKKLNKKENKSKINHKDDVSDKSKKEEVETGKSKKKSKVSEKKTVENKKNETDDDKAKKKKIKHDATSIDNEKQEKVKKSGKHTTALENDQIDAKQKKKTNKKVKLENAAKETNLQVVENENIKKKKKEKVSSMQQTEDFIFEDEIGFIDDDVDDGWISEPFESEEELDKFEKQDTKKKSKTKKDKNKLKITEIEDDEGISSSSEIMSSSVTNDKKKAEEKQKNLKSEKRKLDDEDGCDNISKKAKIISEKKEKRKHDENLEKDVAKKTKIAETSLTPLPGVIDFFSDTSILNDQRNESDSDTDVNKEDEEGKTKKKRLTAAERKEMARRQEEEIRKKEMELLEASENPQSADQFDRLLLANPNSSRLWIQYMSFYLGNTQNDRARAVARKAIETINMRESQEKLNVWLALLNLENRFGDKETFEKTFEEAVRCNDSYQVYLETIKMFAESQNYVEMQDKIRKFKGKFKQEPKMWIEVAKVYYNCGRFQDARNLKQGALRSVINKKEHIDLLTQFAIMEFNYGEPEHGEALFETIIQSVPQRVDVWCTYVDQLVKKDKMDLARRVLDRSICQRMSSKRIATLFKKYKAFEEKYGSQESLDRLKQLALEYTPIE